MKSKMKFLFNVFLFSLINLGAVSAQEAFQPERVEPKLLRVIPNGSGPTAIGFQNLIGSEPSGPEAIAIDASGWIYAWDYVNERAVRFDAGSRIEVIPDARPFAHFLSLTPDGRLIAQDWGIARVFTIEQTGLKQIMEVLPQNFPIRSRSEPYFLSFGNFIIGEYLLPSGYEVFSIEYPSGNTPVFRNHEETLRFVRAGQTRGKGLWVDEKGYLWVDNRLFTFMSGTFLNYWLSGSGQKLNYTERTTASVRGELLSGVDKYGNYYWEILLSTRGKVYVFDKNGMLVKHQEFPYKELPRTRLTVDPDGNLYFMQHTENGHILYKIENTWVDKRQTSPSIPLASSSSKIAYSTESRVRVWSAGNLQSDTLGYLEKGDRVEILEQSKEKVKMDTMNEYWYRIKRQSDGLTGWAYGGFLKLE